MTFATSGTPTTVGTGTGDFNFVGATDSTAFNPDAVGGNFFGAGSGSAASLSNSFGELVFTSNAANSSVIDLKVTPTLSNGTTPAVNFSGTVEPVTTGSTTYQVSFAATTGSTQVTIGGVAYTDIVSNGVNYAVQTTETLDTSLVGKGTWINGYIAGVAGPVAPEPGTMATAGLALALVGFLARRKTNVSR
jgi:hypothetical protein